MGGAGYVESVAARVAADGGRGERAGLALRDREGPGRVGGVGRVEGDGVNLEGVFGLPGVWLG